MYTLYSTAHIKHFKSMSNHQYILMKGHNNKSRHQKSIKSLA